MKIENGENEKNVIKMDEFVLRSPRRNISGNPLACDCNLLWLIQWSTDMSVKLKSPPRCETPAIFRGMFVRKLKVGEDLHCDTQVQPLLELKPDQDQVGSC